MKLRALFLPFALLCLASVGTAQIAARFQKPILGYLFDQKSRTIRPIAGIFGSSTIEAPLPLTLSIESALLLPDQRHAIIGSSENAEALILDLWESTIRPISGAPSSITAMRTSSEGSVAALYYAAANKILILSGLPDRPAIHTTIALAIADGALSRFAVSDDGSAALLDFSSADQDFLYSWTASGGSRYVLKAGRVSDMAFSGDDAVIVDSGNSQAFLIRNVRDQAAPILIADSADGLSQPVSVFVSKHNEIYIGNSSGAILILDSAGHLLRQVRCSCMITTMTSLANSALRLTDRMDQPIFVLEGTNSDRFMFIPALSGPTQPESAQ